MKEKENLKNNLVLITDVNRSISTVCFGLYFNVGSLIESKKNNGITHLTEHMFFRRLNHIHNKELYYRMESLGGQIRGCTMRQYTCFELTVLSEFAQPAFELMSEFLKDFEWTDDEIKAEKQIVLNEIAEVGNRTDELSAAQMGYDAFLLPVKGTPGSLKRIKAKDINEWKAQYFSCGNCCFVITGNISDAVLFDIRPSLESYKAGPTLPEIQMIPSTAFIRSSAEYLYDDGDENYADVFIYFDLDFQVLDWTQVMIMFDAFCNGDGSKLSFAMKDELGLVYGIDSEVIEYGRYGSLKISWSVADNKLIKSLELFFNLLKEFKSGVTEEEFDSSVVFSTLNMQKYCDNPSDLNNMYGFYDFIVDLPLSITDSVSKRNSIARESIDSVSRKVFKKENMFVEVDFNKKHVDKKQLKALLDGVEI